MIVGWEWVLIMIIVLGLVLWGPKKIPELARSLGQARAEFERAQREAMKPLSEVGEVGSQPSSDDVLIETARKLGISTEGKTREQISKEIVEKFKAKEQNRTELASQE